MLLFLCIIGILVLISIMFLQSDIRLHVYNFEYSNFENPIKKNKIKIEIYLCGLIKILSLKIKKEKIKNSVATNIIKEKILNIKEDKNKLNLYDNKNFNSIIKMLIINLARKVNIKKFKLHVLIGTENVSLTAILVGILYSIIPNILRANIKIYKRNKYYLNISPLYGESNKIYMKLEGIISIKLVHIINMLKYVKYGKENRKKYERSSNRRFNANSHGKHKEYDRC